nr:glycosyltransferase family 2 protein [Micromonospora sp. DSM 115978]
MVMDADDAVAVIVPNFNKEKVLRACLEAVYAQTLPPVEVIVVDDRSTDRSREIAREFCRDRREGPECTLVEFSVNQGPSAARNAGVAASTAPLLFFVDSDTALEPDAIENAVRVLRESPGCGMVQGIYHPEPLFDDGPVEAYQLSFEYFWRRRTVGQETSTIFTASLIPRAVFEATGGFDDGLRHIEDDEFGTRMPARYRLVVTDTVLTRHDDVDRLLPLLREQFVRASVKPLIMLRTWRRQRAGAVGVRGDLISPARFRHLDWSARMSLIVPALALLTIPLVPVVPWLVGTWPVLVVAFVAANREYLRYAYRSRGAGFAGFAAGMHLLVHLALVLGHGVGLFRVARAVLGRRTRSAPVGG